MRYALSSPILVHKILSADLRVFALVFAMCVYAVLGSPTPDMFSWVEIVVGGCLLVSLGLGGFVQVFRVARGRADWFNWGRALLVYGILAGGAGALIGGASFGDIVRDVLPFGFMFLPLFLMPILMKDGYASFYLYAYLCVGVAFAIRAGAPVLGLPVSVSYEALYYLGNSPAVLFVALFLLGRGLEVLSRGIGSCGVMVACLCFAGSALAVLPIIITAQRASMAAVVVYAIFAMCFLFLRAPSRVSVLGVILCVLVVAVFGQVVGQAYDVVVIKSHLVGANMRFEEWAAVWGQISSHPLSFLFGKGWGASFSSPAVADIEVHYTHSLLSSMLLKLGVVGFLLCFSYLAALFMAMMRVFNGREIIVMAVCAPLLIDVFLYAAFKSLDFGLLLGIVPIIIFYDLGATRIASGGSLLYEKRSGS